MSTKQVWVSPHQYGWNVNSSSIFGFQTIVIPTKSKAKSYATFQSKKWNKLLKQNVEMKVQKRNGKLSRECSTYGSDNFPTEG